MEQHPRKIIREKVTDIIKNNKTLAQERVFDSRDFTLDTDTTPAIIVYSQEEHVDNETSQDFGFRCRTMTINIECYAVGENGASNVDLMAWQVENSIHANPTLDNLVEWCVMQNTSMAFADDGENTLHAAVLIFNITYYTHFLCPDNKEPPKTVLANISPQTQYACNPGSGEQL